MSYYKLFTDKITSSLQGLEVTRGAGAVGPSPVTDPGATAAVGILPEKISAEDGFRAWCSLSQEVKDQGREMYFIGNGASAGMAAHMSADTFKNGQILARCFNESSLMTAIGNDIAYEDVFSYPLSRCGKKGDVLVTISSSGNSPNVIKAIHTAKEKGVAVVTLSGMKPDNKSRALGDLNFYIPSKSYGIVESTHQVLLHCWLDMFMDLKPE